MRVVKRESHGLAYLRSARQYQSSGRPERRSAVSTRFEGGHAIFFISLRSAPAARPADVQPNALFSLIISQGSTRKEKKQALNLPLVVGWQPLISSATINLAGHTHIGVSVQPPGQPVDVSIDGRCISSLHRLPSGPLVAHL